MSQARTTSKKPNQEPTPMETDPPKPPPTEAKYVSYTLLAAHDPQLKYNILKFAPSSNRKIEVDSFVQPIKLNRKDPWAIRKKAEEEKKRSTEAQEENASKTGENDNNDDEKDNEMKVDQDNKASSTSTKQVRDDSVIGPAPASQPKKNQPFKKKTKQVFIAADQSARMLKKEEYQSWLLEDGSPNGERWVGRYESAGAAAGSSASASTSTSTNNDASNYVLFRMDPSGEAFQVIPCHRFYRFTQRPNYDTLGADEAEAAYEKMQKPTTKEDVGRWFMRRRGANPSSSGSSQPSKTLDNKTSGNVKHEGDVKPTSFFDHSKVSFGTSNKVRSQVEIPSFINGRRNKFTAVQGSNSRLDDDEDRKPNFGQEGDFDEVDYDEQFDDDEEGAGNLNDEAMEEDELKELAEKMKREMLAAGKAGDDEREKEDVDMAKDDLFGEREDLTKEGKAVKKLLMRKGEDNVYDSDDEVRNPYASEEDESDFEEVVPPPPNGPSPTDAKDPASRSGTPTPGSQPAGTSKSIATKGPVTQASNLKGDKPQSRPPSRSGTPSLPNHSRTNSASHPVHGHGFNAGPANRSRATSPQLPSSQLVSSSTGPRSRAVSPVLSSSLKPSSPISANASTTNSNGKRKQHPNGAIASKEKKLNSGPTPPGRISSTISAAPDQESGVITKEQVVTLLKIRPLTTKELLAHFKQRLKEESNKVIIFAIIREIANIHEGLLVLKDGI
ncbi:hypothetical protein PGT21_035555 [Puccinia graminis f. sp. tritici]|uniref:Transcription initiation factor IIF subunit alpha n=1 Tax=Puccinia graminis f. sp. tritici TaxID=56615 RepID=A0A5B0MY07_PUCGR|nr:hypothetical protein PGT21_035555 [Puccinia graminis f. sp. tritici]KAA1130158.1 hypothetical protein PGTUg99_009976 [Puccinia graminis f. sp. tritici]